MNVLNFMQHGNGSSCSESDANLDGYSFPLCSTIVETLRTREERFHFQTLFVLAHNTRKNSEGHACPIFNGLVVSFQILKSCSFLLHILFSYSFRIFSHLYKEIRWCLQFLLNCTIFFRLCYNNSTIAPLLSIMGIHH